MFIKIAQFSVSMALLKVHDVQKSKHCALWIRNVSTKGSTEKPWLNKVWKMVKGHSIFFEFAVIWKHETCLALVRQRIYFFLKWEQFFFLLMWLETCCQREWNILAC